MTEADKQKAISDPAWFTAAKQHFRQMMNGMSNLDIEVDDFVRSHVNGVETAHQVMGTDLCFKVGLKDDGVTWMYNVTVPLAWVS